MNTEKQIFFFLSAESAFFSALHKFVWQQNVNKTNSVYFSNSPAASKSQRYLMSTCKMDMVCTILQL